MRIDLGGIAKGWSVDRGVEILKGLGIEHAMVNAGGDTRLLGDRNGKPWIVGIRDPRKEGVVVARIPLQDEALSTSGDYERYFEEDGVRYHHILVPGTGHVSRSGAQRDDHRSDGDAHRRSHEARIHTRCRARHGIRATGRRRRSGDRRRRGADLLFAGPRTRQLALRAAASKYCDAMQAARNPPFRRLTGAAAGDNDSRD